ncbi:MAG: LysM peptidoglycan-binding domain-containing protein [Treponema sp.]|jgi:nucleoid-associated protein YgaU|nr:LysM peptidoglycan-binding domain-containing protein [Treponema sp.]
MKFKRFLKKTLAEAILLFHFEGYKSIYKRLVMESESLNQTTRDSSSDAGSRIGSTNPKEFLRVYYYTVKPGDTYWSIANRLYGDSHQWKYVYEANKNKVSHLDNPNLILPGMILEIPDIPRYFTVSNVSE